MRSSTHVRNAALLMFAAAFFTQPAISAPRLSTLNQAQTQAQPQRQVQRTPAVPLNWEAQWVEAWQRAAGYYQIAAAPTTATSPACQANLGIDVLVRNTILATANRKYGDAAAFISQFQDKTLCLSREGARGVEFALSMYLHNAVTRLPPDQAQIALYGSLNLGALIFDQLQYTRNSWWLMTANIDADRIHSLMQNYPRQQLGLVMYDSHNGYLVQSRRSDAIDQLLAATRSLGNFGFGTCELLDMSTTGFRCPDAQLTAGGALPINNSRAPGGAFGLMPAATPDVGMACVIASIQSSGPRGQLACVSKFAIPPNPALTSPADLAKLADEQPGVIDTFCARGEDAESESPQPVEQKKPIIELPTWDEVVDATGKVLSGIASLVVSVFDQTPPVISELGQLASPEGAKAVEGGLTAIQSRSSQNSLLYDSETNARFEQQRETMHRPQRTSNDNGATPGGNGCGRNGSNAAQRAIALYSCLSGQSGPQISARKGGASDPRVSYTNPDQVSGPVTGAMSCVVQSGDLVRNSLHDARCAVSRCAPGAPCPCNAGGALVAEPMQINRPVRAEPRCVEGQCPQDPAPGGTIRPPGGGGIGNPIPAPPVPR